MGQTEKGRPPEQENWRAGRTLGWALIGAAILAGVNFAPDAGTFDALLAQYIATFIGVGLIIFAIQEYWNRKNFL